MGHSKSLLQDAIDAAVKDKFDELKDDLDEKVEAAAVEWAQKNLLGLIEQAVGQMLATPKGARKAGTRAPGHNHRGRCGDKCFTQAKREKELQDTAAEDLE